MTEPAKPPVFLLDAMSFIFRAYHAMQRSRPMSTRSGLPTAATYVFVNMIKKLRQDFSPKYFAAVFDVSGEVFRDERARAIEKLRRWNAKSQSFEDVSYDGYKAKRESMPEDLRRQIPYIRRALEALRIPILQAEGFEAYVRGLRRVGVNAEFNGALCRGLLSARFDMTTPLPERPKMNPP